MAEQTTIRVFTKLSLPEDHILRKCDDLDDATVAIILDGYAIVEYADGTLAPMIQLRPAVAVKLASALGECAGEVIQRWRAQQDSQ